MFGNTAPRERAVAVNTQEALDGYREKAMRIANVIIGSDKDQNRECSQKGKKHMGFQYELYEAQVARGRYFVHELTADSQLKNEVRDEDHGHARNENDRWRTCACLEWPHAMKEGHDSPK